MNHLRALLRVGATVALACPLASPPAGAQTTDTAGSGTVTAPVTHTAPMTFPGPCLHLHLDSRSDAGYRGTYVAKDSRGGKHTYSGPLSLTMVVDTNESFDGTYKEADCSGTPGYEQPIRSATLASPPGDSQSVSCDYNGTYAIRDAQDITIKLNGTCELTDQGVTYKLESTEVRKGEVTSTTGTPPTQIKWKETYSATTTCSSASCDVAAPAPAPTPGAPVPPAASTVAPSASASPGGPSVPLPPPTVPASRAVVAAPPADGQGPADPLLSASTAESGAGVVAADEEAGFSDRGLRVSENSDSRSGPGSATILLLVLGVAAAIGLGSNWVNGRRIVSWPRFTHKGMKP